MGGRVARRRTGEARSCRENFRRFAAGEILLNIVDKTVGVLMHDYLPGRSSPSGIGNQPPANKRSLDPRLSRQPVMTASTTGINQAPPCAR